MEGKKLQESAETVDESGITDNNRSIGYVNWESTIVSTCADAVRETVEMESLFDFSDENFVLVDDIRSVRYQVGKLIKGVNGNVVGEFLRGEDLISSLEKIPEGAIVILDNEMGRGNLPGVQIARLVQKDRPDLRIVMFSGDDQVPVDMLKNEGVIRAFVSKHAGNDKVLEVVRLLFGKRK